MQRRVPFSWLVASSLAIAAGCGSPSSNSATDGSVQERDAAMQVTDGQAVDVPAIKYFVGGCGTSSGSAAVPTDVSTLPYGLTVLATGLSGVGTLEADATNVYLSSSGSIYRMLLANGASSVMVSGASPTATAIDGNNIYWSDGTVVGQTTILSAPLSATGWSAFNGSAGMTAATLDFARSPGAPGVLTLAGGSIYFSAGDVLARVPVGGGSVEPIVSGVSPTGIAVGSDQVYLGDNPNETIDGVALTGGNAGTLGVFAQSYATPSQLALAGGNLYWGDWLGGIESVPIATPDASAISGTPCGGGACYPRLVRPGGSGAVWEADDSICGSVGEAGPSGTVWFAVGLRTIDAIAAADGHLYAVTGLGELLRWDL